MKPEVDLAIGELVKHGVIHKDEIDSALEKYPEAASIDDRDALGDFLEQIGLITAFQAGELRNKRIADLAMANYLILDRLGDRALLLHGESRHAARTDLAAVGDELAKQVDVLVVDVGHIRCKQRCALLDACRLT